MPASPADTPGTLRVGAPQWNHPNWRDLAGSGSAWSLRRYAALLSAVEGNTTFYATPSAATVERWRAQVPDDFRFCFKLPRDITHEASLEVDDAVIIEWVERFRPLHEVMGPTSIQLPARFGPAWMPTLARFLDRIPDLIPWAVEVRHDAFFSEPWGPRLDALLRDHGVDRVVLDSRALFAGPMATPAEVEAFRRKPRLPVRGIRTGIRPVVRIIGQSDPAATEGFWSPWIDRVATWLAEGCDVHVFLHTPDNAVAPMLAQRFHALVRARCPGLPELSGRVPVDPSAQPALW